MNTSLFSVLIFLCMLASDLTAQSLTGDLKLLFDRQEKVDCIIVMDDQLDLYGLTEGLTKNQKAAYVYDRLSSHASQDQRPIRSYLKNQGIAHRPFLIFNGIQAILSQKQAEYVLSEFAVAEIVYNEPSQVQELDRSTLGESRSSAEWGIMKIKADSVWQLGYEGAGVVVGGQDTGYDWDNPLIVDRYRGNDGGSIDHNYNWHDAIDSLNALHGDTINDPSLNPCGFLSSEPCDDHGHGSHTMGTMVGQDSSNQIGVAPAASWIGCRNMDRGYGKPSTYTECFEWFLAPTDLAGQNADPSKAPHVIANSWGCPPMEGCNASNWAFMETAVNNLSAAGTVVVVSAGNSGGQGCGSVSNPAAIFENSFTVGATNASDAKAGFSSIGPVTVDSSFRLKPDIVAPGVQVRSIYLNEEFRTWNGTSMAGPHVAGAVALIINANPDLAGQVDEIKDIIRSTAVPLVDSTLCNGNDALMIPNFYYGHGRIDVLAAVQKARSLTSTIDPNTTAEISIYPNPNSGIFHLQSDQPILDIKVSDITGRPVSININPIDTFHAIISATGTGTFIVTAYTAKGVTTKKVFIQSQ